MVRDFFLPFYLPYTNDASLLIHMEHEKQICGWQLWVKTAHRTGLHDVCCSAGLIDHGGFFTAGSIDSTYKEADVFSGKKIRTGPESILKPLQVKAEKMIEGLLASGQLCIYTGAGLSTASGVWSYKMLCGLLGLENLKSFIQTCTGRREELDHIIRVFMSQLFDSEPSFGHAVIHKLNQDYQCIVFTENLDNLHQKLKTRVITRNNFQISSLLLKGKQLLVLGVSDDHSGLIRKYRRYMPQSGIYVVNDGSNLPYIEETDQFVKEDVQIFLQRLNEAIDRKSRHFKAAKECVSINE